MEKKGRQQKAVENITNNDRSDPYKRESRGRTGAGEARAKEEDP